MKSAYITISLAVLIVLICQEGITASEKYDCTLKWHSIKTAHFWIHYHSGLEETARECAQIAEKVHDRLTADLGWTPKLRTDVILVDSKDMANGYATIIPYNRIQLYVARPEPDSELNNYRRWLEMVFTHEYAHILTIDQVNSLPYVIRHILGRINFPNQYLPVWTHEGISVYSESRYSSMGRNNSTYTDMVMRREVLSGTFKSISEASHYPRRWPAGSVPYLYGGLFVQYLEKTYGQNNIARFLRENGDNFLPYSDNIYPFPCLFNKDVKDVYGKAFFRLWEEWEKKAKETYARQAQEIIAAGLTGYSILSDDEADSRLPRFSNDGKSIYYIRSSQRDRARLMKIDLNSGEKKRICRVHHPNAMCIVKDTVFLADVEYYRSYSLFSEAYVYTGRYKRLTKNLRGKYISLSGDGTRSVYVTARSDSFSLVLSDPAFRKKQILINETSIQLAHPSLSPDNLKVVFMIKDSRGQSDLILLDLYSGDFLRITNDAHADIEPIWHPDGNRIIFSSDRSGVYNLYEYDVNKKVIRRLTNLLGGAFSPDISPDGRSLVFSSYETNGHGVALMPYPAEIISSIEVEPIPLPDDYFAKIARDPIDSPGDVRTMIMKKRYNPFFSVFPSFYFPSFAIDEIYDDTYDYRFGVSLSGSDTLYRHLYQVSADFTVIQERATVSASYTYARLYPDITFGYYDSALFYGKDGFPWNNTLSYPLQRTLERSGYVRLLFPLKYYNHLHNFSIIYVYEKRYIDRYEPIYLTDHHEDIYAHFTVSYYFSDTRFYPYSISREHGRQIEIKGRIYHKEIGSDSSFYRVSGQYAEYLPGFFKSNVLMLRFRGGFTIDNPDYLSSYNLGRFERGISFSTPVGEEEWGIRGYPSGYLYGNNIITSTAEYRFPIVQKDAGAITVPIMFRDLWMSLFFDCGNVWDKKSSLNDFRYSAGAEMHINLTVGYILDLSAYVGYAYGFSSPGEHQVYFALSSYMEGMFSPPGISLRNNTGFGN